MNIRTLQASLLRHPDRAVRFVLPDGTLIPAAVHVTEVGHVRKNFIDCGGTVRATEACVLQTWRAGGDDGHRLAAGKLARILDLAKKVLPSGDLAVEVEYDIGAVAQFEVEEATVAGPELRLVLAHKHTDCVAREVCGVAPEGEGCGCGATAGRCC
jgi:hypothetical protein